MKLTQEEQDWLKKDLEFHLIVEDEVIAYKPVTFELTSEEEALYDKLKEYHINSKFTILKTLKVIDSPEKWDSNYIKKYLSRKILENSLLIGFPKNQEVKDKAIYDNEIMESILRKVEYYG